VQRQGRGFRQCSPGSPVARAAEGSALVHTHPGLRAAGIARFGR